MEHLHQVTRMMIGFGDVFSTYSQTSNAKYQLFASVNPSGQSDNSTWCEKLAMKDEHHIGSRC